MGHSTRKVQTAADGAVVGPKMPIEDEPALDGVTDDSPLVSDDGFALNGEDTFDDALGGADLASDLPTDLPPGHKRRPGRQPGSAKVPGSGRRKGSRNVVSNKVKETVTDVFDKYGPLAMQRLFNVAFGRKIRVSTVAGPNPEYVYPSEASQMKALEILARKLRADLASQQITGKDGTDLFQPELETNPRQVARAIIQVLGGGVAGADGIAPGSSPAGLGADAPAAPGAAPDAISGADNSLPDSPAGSAHISKGGEDSAGSYGERGAIHSQKKSIPEKNKIQITDRQDNAGPVAEPDNSGPVAEPVGCAKPV